ncbi:MAG: serine--tRNA ligase [Candidatus Bipolaricaulota bacterium]|nr:serine--tRNA ligase [Candidatus Bipolaricaulota bacterium]MCS7275114.1 serine--tRNA ligase [Candidatus Bipolaricaulota bacterium]MDW8111188.1 serine--tRNA ligase [Candidatus Bipolaricaulota bacterium]MDW8329885.1 serine--tRNA ligase [Candidatus Bipolaricaulota bacterium]
MLDLKLIRENPKEVERRLRTRGEPISLDRILKLDEERRQIIQRVEQLKAQRNKASDEIGRLKREQRDRDAERLIAEMGQIADEIKSLDGKLAQIEHELNDLLARLPNLPHESVPVSTEKSDKVILREFGEKPKFSFTPKSHVELGERLNILDFPRAARIAGSRFPLYKGLGAMLEMALVQFMLHYQVQKNKYIPIFPPFLGNAESFFAAGQLPKFADQVYFCPEDKLYLNPTAEILLTNLHRDEILDGSELPLKYCAYTACFRREAGTYGEEEKGLIRMHQFNKVELFKFTKPEESYQELESLVEDAEDILKELKIHYRAALLPSCDLGQQSAKTIDLEVWIPSQNRYYEVSSCSNCEDFQARRGNIRFRRDKTSKPEYVHTLNGSGLATSRLFVAILENNQQPDGSVIIPEPLRDYVGTDRLTPP